MEKQVEIAFSFRNLLQFFLLTFLFSWLVWGGILVFSPADDLILPLIFLGAFGPSLTAVLLFRKRGGTAEKDFWKRVFDFRLIKGKYLLFILLIFPAILLLGYSIYSLAGGTIPSAEMYFGGINSLQDFLLLLGFMLLGGPLAEELGWRGYSQEPLQERFGKIRASLLLGVIWVIWHLPLFFIEGTSQHSKGFGIAFWSWSLQIILISFIFTWVYNKTNRSILAAVLLHLMANFAYPLGLDNAGEVVFSLVRVLVVLPILIAWLTKEIPKGKHQVPMAG